MRNFLYLFLWSTGISLILTALFTFKDTPVWASFFLAMGFIMLPPVSRKLRKKKPKAFSEVSSEDFPKKSIVKPGKEKSHTSSKETLKEEMDLHQVLPEEDLLAQLEKLAQLKEQDFLTKEEFKEQKKKLLNKC